MLDSMVVEYTAEIQHLLPPASAADALLGRSLDRALQDRAALRRWVTQRLYQTALSAMPIGLLHDPSHFPHHSKTTRAWEDARRARQNRPALPLDDTGSATGRYQRAAEMLAILQPDHKAPGGGGGGASGAWSGDWLLLEVRLKKRCRSWPQVAKSDSR